jgi:hypothetical protein
MPALYPVIPGESGYPFCPHICRILVYLRLLFLLILEPTVLGLEEGKRFIIILRGPTFQKIKKKKGRLTPLLLYFICQMIKGE